MAHSVALPGTEDPSTAKVSIEEYLRTEYRPDVEYIDGVLKEKPVVGFAHGRLQGLLCAWFYQHSKEWKIYFAVETRTRVGTERFRLPDLVVVGDQESAKGALHAPPLIAIEVLSPSDTYAELRDRATDLHAMGTQNIWLIDPDQRTAEVWNGQSWLPHAGDLLQAVNSPMHIDLAWLWEEMDS